ncbi:S1 family peptidase [Amycolatopsis acidiphila]|uniref:S1 family peptidase n=1 Tax=Amycolatopsis acidiphila TaxID=715473 RepID=A0A557ZTK9_9PSEU|nr:S1 family peptidase [Amycolatopsis acidiphila]TVT15345.1 S1 family peptidase [Amycolatopsis acidiphila]UIJ62220.1 S1 family peptidase [Amycolatopsis acidiphila]GHG92697.1 serine protease [Amycolatopsis acidiphila]
MKRTSLMKSVGVAGLVAGAAVAVCLAPSAAAQPVADAMQRDLGLTAEQVQTRLAQEAMAMNLAPAAQSAAGQAFGGSWYDAAAGRLVVGVTDTARADAVRATGADAVTVAHTQAALDAAKSALDGYAGQTAPKEVTGWYVDEQANSLVVTVEQGVANPAVQQFLDFARSAGPVRVDSVTQAPHLFGGNVVGGDAYYINNAARCSVGFSVSGGFVSAGHCGSAGDSVTGPDGSAMGTFQASSFPGNDYSYVRTDSSWTPTSTVDGYGNGDVRVAGSTAAGVGSSVCRSGSTSGWHCGTIQATNQTVNYSEGTVSGLTKTNACAEPGDSGGSWVSGSQAQGVTSGGSGDCTSGGTTYFQPVNEILSAYGLSLVTG